MTVPLIVFKCTSLLKRDAMCTTLTTFLRVSYTENGLVTLHRRQPRAENCSDSFMRTSLEHIIFVIIYYMHYIILAK